MIRAALGLLVLPACLPGEPAPDLSGLSVDFFQCEVQPIFDRSCAFTSCHGNPGRAFFTYSLSKKRIADELLLGEPLTDKEVCANFVRAGGFVTADPLKSPLITKPATLGSEDRQFHRGNYFFGPADPEARCLTRWMEGEELSRSSSVSGSACRLPWRIAGDGTTPSCAGSQLDCDRVLEGPDLPAGGAP